MFSSVLLNWLPKPAQFSLAGDEIHLWRASISEVLPAVRLEELSDSERNKATTLNNPGVRSQFIVSRWLTRQLLGGYLQVLPVNLEFMLCETGKPTVAGLEFNRSHAGGWFALAVAKNLAVGVDIEKVASRPQVKAIVDRWFEPAERAEFAALSEVDRIQFFYHHWTRKEAILKSWGVGLVKLSQFSEYEKQTWKQNFELKPDFVGCLAVAQNKPEFRLIAYDVV